MKVQTTAWQQTTLERINRTAGQENEQQDKQIEDIKIMRKIWCVTEKVVILHAIKND